MREPSAVARYLRPLRFIASLALLATLSACRAVVLSPSGDIAARQRDLLVQSTLLMLIVILPVMALTVLFAWRYRRSNTAARYEPEWEHSMPIELIVWAAPLLIVICLGALTWVGTHLLDPFRPLDRTELRAVATQDAGQSLQVDAVALDWKWLFIYPQYGIATVNELAAPVDRPIEFHITASSIMNSFSIPALAGQIYAMPGMETRLHAVANRAGDYEGFSANYSGSGFSGMHFAFRAMMSARFDLWLAAVRSAGGALSRARYLALARPSENDPVQHFAAVDPGLYQAILTMCVAAGASCNTGMMVSMPGMAGMQGMQGMAGMAGMPGMAPAR